MKKSFITLAILIAIVPHLGFPQMWKDAFITIAAILAVILVVVPRKETAPQEKTKRETSFVENFPVSQEKKQDQDSHEEAPR